MSSKDKNNTIKKPRKTNVKDPAQDKPNHGSRPSRNQPNPLVKIFDNFSRHLANFRNKTKPAFNRKHRVSFSKKHQNQSSLPKVINPKWWFGIIFTWRFAWTMFRLGLVVFLVSVSFVVYFYFHYREGLSPIIDLDSCLQGQTTKYYDRTGRTLLWASKSDVDCQIVGLDQISPYLIEAVLTAEDQNFYSHRGFEPTAIGRAAWHNLRNQTVQGGSTITQQYIKNAILKDRQRHLSRKIKELILAIEMDRIFSKDEILKAYLNTISFGSIYEGIESASQGYFGKNASQLTLAEASLLTAAIPAPSSRWANQTLHREKQIQILEAMLARGKISQDEYQKALKEDVFKSIKQARNQYEDIKAPHFILEVEKILENQFNQGKSVRLKGWRVVTTIDLEAQRLAEQAVAEALPEIDSRGFDNAAVVAIEVPTGKVIGLVGSRDFNYPKFGQTNTVTTKRSPGSAFKPFNYGALISESDNWGPGSTFYDYLTVFTNKGYEPKNYTDKYKGPTTMRSALGRSLNTVAVKSMYLAGIKNVHDFAKNAGLRSGIECGGGYCGLSSAIGGGAAVRLDELANAYATFGRNGFYQPIAYIDKIYDSNNNLFHKWRPQPKKVMDDQVAWLINDMLSDRKARYSQRFNLDNAVGAIKTGTTDDWRNNHIFGYTKSVSFGAWMGHHDITVGFEQDPKTGKPKEIILKKFMDEYHKKMPESAKNAWARPAGIQKFHLDLETGYQIPESEIGNYVGGVVRADYYPSWYQPTRRPDVSGKIEIDLISRKRATACTPTLARSQIEAISIKPELDLTDEFYDHWMQPIRENLTKAIGDETAVISGADDVHKCSDQLPRIRLSGPTVCEISCRIIAEIIPGSHPVDKVNFKIGNKILPNGSINVNNNSGRISYNYEPEDEKLKQVLTAEIIDQVLYRNSDKISLQTVVADDNPENINLEMKIDNNRSKISLFWNRKSSNLQIEFDGICSFLPTIDLPSDQTELEVAVRQPLVDGVCQANLLIDQDRIDVGDSFLIDSQEIIYPSNQGG